MPMDLRSIEALCLFAGAAALGGQAWLARRQERRMGTWPAVAGVIAEARPETGRGEESDTYLLHLTVDAAEGRLVPRALLAQSESELRALVETHLPGTAIQLRRDPEYARLWVEGYAPRSGSGWVLAAALGMLALGVAVWFGLFEALHP
jgi:hypothetical protein